MNIEKVQKIITWLAKSGDKETIQNVAELLSEIGNYKTKGSSVNESRQQPQSPSRPVKDVTSHASAILDGGPSNIDYSTYTPKAPSYERSWDAPKVDPYSVLSQFSAPEPVPPMTNDLPYSGGSRILANNVEMTSHADSLL